MEYEICCDMCSKKIYRPKSLIKKHNFCSRQCLWDYSNKAKNPNKYLCLKDYTAMANVLKSNNPITNKKRMTEEVKEKIRQSRIKKGNGRTYKKLFHKHVHRIIAESILGRPLRKGEVVHHINGNKLDNSKENLMILSSQAEHSRIHMKEKYFWKGGDEK